MSRKIELLAPGGSLDSIKAAIVAGADAVYCGLNQFNARNRAENIVFADLNGMLHLAHQYNCQLFLTLNILIVESEFPALIRLLNKLVNTSIDGVIVQDIGMFYLLEQYFPTLAVHASTQLTTHNEGQIRFLKHLSAQRVNLCRELSLTEIRKLTGICHENKMVAEVFVHGSLCLGFSGLCYFSSVQSGNSGNRGRCSQPCRDGYETTGMGKNFPLNLKDNSAFAHVDALITAGVDSLKIEGRIKKFHYVHTVVRAFKKQMLAVGAGQKIQTESSDLYTVFNRDFSDGFLQGAISLEMFIDNPRDHSALYRAGEKGGEARHLEQAKRELYDLKTEIITEVRAEIDQLDAKQASLNIMISGMVGVPLKVVVQTPETVFTVSSTSSLAVQKEKGGRQLDRRLFLEKFKAINDTEYVIGKLEIADLAGDLFIPFKELTELKKKIVTALRGGRKPIAEVTPPKPDVEKKTELRPTLSLLISSAEDVHLGDGIDGDVYFELPSRFGHGGPEIGDIFTKNKKLIPWFPPVLMGDEFHDALKFLDQVHPARIITNNTGVAYAAMERNIPWLAGPYLNTVNSWATTCLQKRFNCAGAFISNELSRQQIKKLVRPPGFELHHSIYHPIMLMTSRQCLVQQVSGCEKKQMDATCIGQCARSAVIEGGKGGALLVKKREGQHHALYHHVHFLNTEVAMDVPGLFTSFCVDLRRITTDTNLGLPASDLLRLFGQYIKGNSEATAALHSKITPTTLRQYHKGI